MEYTYANSGKDNKWNLIFPRKLTLPLIMNKVPRLASANCRVNRVV